ncbi:MAG: helix-turn-helix domain-containing protein [Lachnospiraceae bacterium]|nr:helix-turn-helix domain-containing protein [Lachnospiraceae bacterium]
MVAGTRIRELRLNHGYRQSDLADRVGCSTQVISNIERSVTGVSADMALKIANEFHVPVEDIMQEPSVKSVCLTQEEFQLLSDYRKLLSMNIPQ